MGRYRCGIHLRELTATVAEPGTLCIDTGKATALTPPHFISSKQAPTPLVRLRRRWNSIDTLLTGFRRPELGEINKKLDHPGNVVSAEVRI
jgi:hypothetical protein